MSLNGIDTPRIVEAYQKAFEADGRWLLLSYTSRDEVDLFQEGSDGLTELHNAIANYPEKSPLYGFLHYLEKKVVVKYVPDGTSRLLQARTTVHLQAVSDKFSPHDALLAAAASDDLNEPAFRRACSLPEQRPEEGNTTSVMSQTDHDRDKGDESATDESKAQSTNIHVEQPKEEKDLTPTIPRPSTAKKQTAATELTKELDELDHSLLGADLAEKKRRPKSNEMMGMKAFLTEVTPPHTPGIHSQEPRVHDFAPAPSIPRASEDVPKTSYSSRTSTSDIWRTWKPKLKMGPRPITDAKIGGVGQDRQKLPAGYKAKHFKTDREWRPKSRKSERGQTLGSTGPLPKTPRPASRREERSQMSTHDNFPPPVPPLSTHVAAAKGAPDSASPNTPSPNALPPMPNSARLAPATSGYSEGRDKRRPAGLGIAAAPHSASTTPLGPKSAPAISPEKQRLMKALQMRRQQHYKTSTDEVSPPSVPKPESRGPTPDHSGSVKNDSGVEVDTSRTKSDADQSSPDEVLRIPLASPTTMTTRVNPLTSHPINTNVQFPNPPRRHTDSPALSAGSNKELPKLPREAEEEQARRHESPVKHIASESRDHSMSSKRRRKDRPSATSTEGHSTFDDQNSEFFHELESAQIKDATPLPAPPKLHDRQVSSTSNTVTAVTIKSSSPRGDKPSTSENRTPTPDQFPKPPPSPMPGPTSLNRHPSTSSRPVSNHQSDSRSNLSGRRPNMSSGISRRIQALAELSQREDSSYDPTYKSAQAFLAPGTLPPEERAARPTAIGRAYEASRSRSPNRHSQARGLRTRASFDNNGDNAEQRKSQGPTGYRKRDSLTVTAHIMRPHQQQLQQLSSLAPSIEEDKESPGDPQDALDALAGERPFSPATEPVQPRLSPPHNRLTFTRRESTSSSDAPRRPSSRGSVVSGIGRSSLDGWRSALSHFGAGARERRDSSMRRESHSSSRGRPMLSRISTHERSIHNHIMDGDGGLDRVDEVSETGTRASRTSRLMKRMSQMSGSGPNSQDNKRKREENGAPKAGGSGFEKLRSEKLDASQHLATLQPSARGKSTIVGDLNVQFPDTLLWKRRWVEVDSNGNLVTSPPKSVDGKVNTSQGGMRRFHLSEFRQPVVPSRERQETRFSVCLDFVEGGGTLQLAAEDRVQQGALVKRLVDCHRVWLYSL